MAWAVLALVAIFAGRVVERADGLRDLQRPFPPTGIPLAVGLPQDAGADGVDLGAGGASKAGAADGKDKGASTIRPGATTAVG
jgi:hypothetical protein